VFVLAWAVHALNCFIVGVGINTFPKMNWVWNTTFHETFTVFYIEESLF